MRLKHGTSLYLDLVRLGAAFTVVLGHLSGRRFTGGFLWQFAPYGPEAVVVFFVLSGFVISGSMDNHARTAGTYIVARTARIYSVALPALLLTGLLDQGGRMIRSDLYSADWGFAGAFTPWQFISGVLFLNQVWSDTKIGSNLAYWSLGFEVWFYVLFAVIHFAPPRWRWCAGAVGAVIAGPKILAMLPLWLLGVATHRLCRRGPRPSVGALLCFGAPLLWAGYEVLTWRYGRPVLALASWLRPEILQDWLVALLFAAHLLGFDAVLGEVGVPGCVARAIRWCAGASFTLYLLHLPIAQFLITVAPWPASSWLGRCFVLGGTVGAVFLIAQVTERQKALWHRLIAGAVGWVQSLRSAQVV